MVLKVLEVECYLSINMLYYIVYSPIYYSIEVVNINILMGYIMFRIKTRLRGKGIGRGIS